MELPSHLKELYRHWEYHTVDVFPPSLLPGDVFSDPGLFDEIAAFTKERLSIWEKKTSGKSAPYTNDPILAKYRFCNIFREFDRQTVEFHTMLQPIAEDFPLWLMNAFYCRMIARTETVQSVWFLTFDADENERVYERLMHLKRPRFGTPYVFPVSTIMRSATPTRELFLTRHLPSVMGKIADTIRSWDHASVYDGVREILPLFGFNHSFLWTEVLIDTAYRYPEHVDLYGAFPIGPGSSPTMKRIKSELEPHELAKRLSLLALPTGVTYEGIPLQLSSENWEGIGCEFRKYTNLRNGGGRKRLFT